MKILDVFTNQKQICYKIEKNNIYISINGVDIKMGNFGTMAINGENVLTTPLQK